MDKEIIDEITKILILSYYEKEWGGRGETASKISSFEQLAYNAYIGKVENKDLPVYNIVHSRITRDVALIMEVVRSHLLKDDCKMNENKV